MGKLMMECVKCYKTGYAMERCCGKPTRTYTGGQAYRREDKWYSWKFFIMGNQRSLGTDRHGKPQDAIADFNEVMRYTVEESSDE